MDAGIGCIDTARAAGCGEGCTDPELWTIQGACFADPTAGSCTAADVESASAALAAGMQIVVSDNCYVCAMTTALRKGVQQPVAADIASCGPATADAADASPKASGAFTTGVVLTALVATAVAM